MQTWQALTVSGTSVAALNTSPINPDTDFGGVIDGIEDGNHNGAIDAGETDDGYKALIGGRGINHTNFEFFQYNYDFTQVQGFPGLPIIPVFGLEASF